MSFLELTDVQKRFAQSVAVENFNLQVERGEFVSFLGPSGCGKTTTLRMIAGFEQPTSGAITLGGSDITRRPANRRNVGMVFQSYALFPNMTVAQNIAFGLKLKKTPADIINRRVGELLGLIHLPEMGQRYPYQLSGGQQQRVALARALAIEPQVLLLDEPLSALDAKIRISLRNEIRSIQRQLGITTIYVTHDQEEALSLSDRIVVMNKGRVEQIGTPFQIYNFPQTTFVASFVGTLNLMRARVADPLVGSLTVEGQQITLGHALEGHTTNDQITLALRPEAIRLAGSANGAGNQLHGAVDEITFLGSIVRVRVRVGEQLVNFDLFNNPHLALPQREQDVTLVFPSEACLALERESTAASPVAVGAV